MKSSVPISKGIEPLFGTRDENIRVLETGLAVRARLLNGSLEIEGEPSGVERATSILTDYAELVRDGHTFHNGDLHTFLKIATNDASVSFRSLVDSGKQRSFGQIGRAHV